jgi:hypothetical protein
MYNPNDQNLEDTDTSISAFGSILSTMDAHTHPANIGNEAGAPTPASMLMKLPAEARLHIFKFIDPRYNLPSEYAGLPSTCGQL